MGSVPGFVVGWAAGTVLGVGTLIAECRRLGLSHARTAVVCVFVVATVLAGTKLLYLAEAWRIWLASPHELWGLVVSPRMRIPGGIALALLAAWPLRAVTGLSAYRIAGEMIPLAAALCLVAVRIGCLLEGCCHGRPSDLPWAISFPPGSGAYLWQQGHGLLTPEAVRSLPVQPLQLYYAISAMGLAAFVVWSRRRQHDVEKVAVRFAFGYFGSSLLLDFLAAVPSPMTRWLCFGALLASVAHPATLAFLKRRYA